jgi:hypothetical protein
MAYKRLPGVRSGEEVADRNLDSQRSVLDPALKKLARLTARTTVTGAKGGNAALASLISALVSAGVITDKTT